MIQREIRIQVPVHPRSLPSAPMNGNESRSSAPSTGSEAGEQRTPPVAAAADSDRRFARRAGQEVCLGGLRRLADWAAGELPNLLDLLGLGG